MNTLMFVASTCVVLAIIGHALVIIIKDTGSVYNMNIAVAKKRMFGANSMVSTSTVKKELLRQRIVNTIGSVLGVFTVITILGLVVDFAIRTFLFS